MGKRFKVKGTDTFFYWAVGLLALGLWCVKDGWFPSQMKIDSKTADELKNFVLFNKSLAYICLPVSAVCAYIHRIVR
ncbi:MAG TPA: hypothetical protein PKE12_10710 [Kiritimatiellia bacterium]|nr:hypothetical protein [Kiritimatiellia bacterium]